MRKIILTAEDINNICLKIGGELTKKFANNVKPPVFIGVINGGVPFLTDLVKKVNVPLVIDYVQVKSWSGLKSTGEVNLVRDLESDIKGRDIVIVEDIVDSGFSMEKMLSFLGSKQPSSMTVVALLNKKCARKVDVQLDYYGKEVGNEFLMGYGLDYYDLFRNTDYVFVPDKEEVASWDEIIKKAGI